MPTSSVRFTETKEKLKSSCSRVAPTILNAAPRRSSGSVYGFSSAITMYAGDLKSRFDPCIIPTNQIEALDVGKIYKMRIYHDGKGIGDGWFLEKVDIKRLTMAMVQVEVKKQDAKKDKKKDKKKKKKEEEEELRYYLIQVVGVVQRETTALLRTVWVWTHRVVSVEFVSTS